MVVFNVEVLTGTVIRGAGTVAVACLLSPFVFLFNVRGKGGSAVTEGAVTEGAAVAAVAEGAAVADAICKAAFACFFISIASANSLFDSASKSRAAFVVVAAAAVAAEAAEAEDPGSTQRAFTNSIASSNNATTLSLVVLRVYDLFLDSVSDISNYSC